MHFFSDFGYWSHAPCSDLLIAGCDKPCTKDCPQVCGSDGSSYCNKCLLKNVSLSINKKHCQRHNGPMGWHHKWRYLQASKFSQQVVPHAFDGKFSHQRAPFALVRNLATRWRHMYIYIAWDFLLASSVSIGFVSSSIRVTSAMSSNRSSTRPLLGSSTWIFN